MMFFWYRIIIIIIFFLEISSFDVKNSQVRTFDWMMNFVHPVGVKKDYYLFQCKGCTL